MSCRIIGGKVQREDVAVALATLGLQLDLCPTLERSAVYLPWSSCQVENLFSNDEMFKIGTPVSISSCFDSLVGHHWAAGTFRLRQGYVTCAKSCNRFPGVSGGLNLNNKLPIIYTTSTHSSLLEHLAPILHHLHIYKLNLESIRHASHIFHAPV